MKRNLETYVERFQRLINHFTRIKRGDEIITGGIAANHYIKPEYRRFSDDIDIIVDNPGIYPGETLKIPDFPEYDIKVIRGNGYKIYIFRVPEDVRGQKVVLRTFLEYFGKDIQIEVMIISPKMLADSKYRFLSWDGRKREVTKDLYDLLTSDELFRFFKERKITPQIAGYLLVIWKSDLLGNAIVSIKYPTFISDRARKLCEKAFPDYTSALKLIIYCEKQGFLRKLSKKLGIKTTLAKDIADKIELDDMSTRKVVEIYLKNVYSGRKYLLEKLGRS